MSDLLELAKSLRYDLTAAQGKLTELTRQIALLPDDSDRSGTYTDRQIARARAKIESGEWGELSLWLLDVELDDMGIPGTDRPALYRLAGLGVATA